MLPIPLYFDSLMQIQGVTKSFLKYNLPMRSYGCRGPDGFANDHPRRAEAT